MELYFILYFFIIGLVLGSFFNVVGMRLPVGETFVNSRSVCPKCQHQLTWRELVPVFSYVWQRGSCRKCQGTISPIYPITELVTGVLFALSFYQYNWSFEFLFSVLLISLLAIVWVSDISYMLIPNKVLLFFLPFMIGGRILLPLEPWWSPWVGGVVGYFLVFLIILVSRGGMGGGDMKLIGLLGIALGLRDVMVAFFLSTLYGTILSLILVKLGKVKRREAVPFGPYIVLGTITAYFFADSIVKWYIDTFFF